MAPCCYNGSVALHQSDAAKKMRAEIAKLIAGGKSDREILDLYIQRQGKRILAEPEVQRGHGCASSRGSHCFWASVS